MDSKNKKIKCNHKISSKNTSLSFLPMTTFEYPQVFRAVCLCCGKSFNFTKDTKGNFVEINEEEEKC